MIALPAALMRLVKFTALANSYGNTGNFSIDEALNTLATIAFGFLCKHILADTVIFSEVHRKVLNT